MPPLITLREVTHGFRGPALLEGANLQIEPGERIGLLGRNGTGKTTLMRLLAGELEPDRGEIVRGQGVRIAFLEQEVPLDLAGSVYDVVTAGLGDRARRLAEYHRLGARLAEQPSDRLHAELDRLTHQLEADGGWDIHQRVERVISQTQLDADAETGALSAGMKRRVLLARALVGGPDLLLLDEPTNHLDIEAIDWLESFLARHEGALLFVTHDRVFLRRLADRILDLDRGHLTNWVCNYETYLDRKAAALEAEAKQQALFDKKLAQEEVWIRQGILARRTRNEGRVRALVKMREERRQRRDRLGKVRLEVQESERSGRLVIRADGVTFGYDDVPVFRDFSTRIMRGDRIGILGPNGSGKTTLLRVLLGNLAPWAGTVRHGTNLEVAYFDQLHAQLDDESTVQDNVADGGAQLIMNGKRKQVIGYLQDFLFTPEQARGPVKYLSGGERNRLLLARLFARPANVLVMDEPTNDLDIETLELLEELLLDFPGTLLLVSHDRAFINNVVTSTLVFEGDGLVKEYAGGYDDWLAQRGPPERVPTETKTRPKPKPQSQPHESKPRLTYKEKLELEALPEKIEALEAAIAALHETTAEAAFYQQESDAITETMDRLKALERELAEVYARWEYLEERAGS